MPSPTGEKYFLYGFLFVVIVLTVLIFRPFLTIIILGASFSVVLYPVYNYFNTRVSKNISWLSSLLTVILFVLLVCGPLFLLGTVVIHQFQNVYQTVTDAGTPSEMFAHLQDSVNGLLPESIHVDVKEQVSALFLNVTDNVAKIFASTVTIIFSFMLVLLAMFYFLKDGTEWRDALIHLSPLEDTDDRKILQKLADAVNGVVKGYLLIAIVQGTLMGIGLAVFGVPNPALWGVMAGIASLVPTIGTALISGPAIIYLFIVGHTGAAVGMLIWATILVGSIDNVLNPIVVGRKVNLPPLLVLFAVLGGVVLMGPSGILIGPLVLSLLYVLVSIYRSHV